jgi:TolB-like protein
MRLYAGSGRRGAALQLYRSLVDTLKSELGAQPDAETQAVFATFSRAAGSTTPVIEARKPAASVAPAGVPSINAPPISSERRSLHPLRWQDWAILATAVASVVAIAIWAGLPRLAIPQAPAAATADTAPSSATSGISIAVLPFANLSGDPNQEFFSDGMTEEIGAALARIPNLSVVARASAFQFKGEKKDMRAVGQALGARYVIDGSVRTAGKRVRITAQLIQADSGLSLWSDSYDRELNDVFAIQEDIAHAITASLRTPLGLKADENLVNNRGVDAESYQQFLRAKALTRDRESDARAKKALTDATALLEPIVARNPDFAPAWGQLALIYQRMPLYLPENTTVEAKRLASDQWLAKAEMASERAIALDPAAPDGYASLGLTMAFRGHLLRADELFSKALALDPFYPEALHSYANLLSAVGNSEEALATKEKLTSIEPFVPVYGSNLAELRWINGQTEAAIARLKTMPRGRGAALLARIYAATGRDPEAVDTLRMIPPGIYPDGMLENAVRLMSTGPTDAGSPQTLSAMNAELNFVYLHVGALGRILQPLENNIAAGHQSPFDVAFVWEPSFAPLRKTERFKAFAREYGLVEYWRAKGWPWACHPKDGDDFVCD